MSPGISGGKQVIKFDKTSSYHSGVFFILSNEKTILVYAG